MNNDVFFIDFPKSVIQLSCGFDVIAKMLH